ncbi:MAG: acetyl-CoA carboxylase biotin carboxylase subunit [Myxococcota bacterium]
MPSRDVSSLLVANRGEIALRVMKTARAMGLRTLAVYSDADADAPHVLFADDAARLGPGPVAESYLSVEKVLEAARRLGADALHPGYGFLSENASFARAVQDAGLTFVGPPPDAIEIMGDKARAKRHMVQAGVPCVPGYQGEESSDAVLIEAAREVGFPIMVKAAAGGGGRGMRLVRRFEELPQALALARNEAESAFGSGDLIIERAIRSPRHVEIQVMADDHGRTLYLGERDCSVQRRHQKVIEEAPCPALTPELRTRMGAAAVAAAEAVDYRGAGTVEFLLDGDGKFYFLEMNTRLQVEHPVTELVTGLDLVELQLRVARGEPLPLTQEEVRLDGWAMEVRLYAEDPAQDFLPSTGRVALWKAPSGPGVRVDAGIRAGSEVSPFYDAMVAKIMAHGADRDQARRRLLRALQDTALIGLPTNRDFLVACLGEPGFAAGQATTSFLTETFPAASYTAPQPGPIDFALAAAVLRRRAREEAETQALGVHPELLDWSTQGGLEFVHVFEGSEAPQMVRVQSDRSGTETVAVQGTTFRVRVVEVEGSRWRLSCDDRVVQTRVHQGPDALTLVFADKTLAFVSRRAGQPREEAGEGCVRAPMHGKLTSLEAQPGQRVIKGERLGVLEAMKMHFELNAPIDGTVAEIHAEAGAQIAAQSVILEIQPA